MTTMKRVTKRLLTRTIRLLEKVSGPQKRRPVKRPASDFRPALESLGGRLMPGDTLAGFLLSGLFVGAAHDLLAQGENLADLGPDALALVPGATVALRGPAAVFAPFAPGDPT